MHLVRAWRGACETHDDFMDLARVVPDKPIALGQALGDWSCIKRFGWGTSER
jgi:hypothetical protein